MNISLNELQQLDPVQSAEKKSLEEGIHNQVIGNLFIGKIDQKR